MSLKLRGIVAELLRAADAPEIPLRVVYPLVAPQRRAVAELVLAELAVVVDADDLDLAGVRVRLLLEAGGHGVVLPHNFFVDDLSGKSCLNIITLKNPSSCAYKSV